MEKHQSLNIYLSNIYQHSRVPEKKPPGRDKSISNHRPGEKEKIIGQKIRKGQPRPLLEKNQGIRSQLVKRKLKTCP